MRIAFNYAFFPSSLFLSLIFFSVSAIYSFFSSAIQVSRLVFDVRADAVSLLLCCCLLAITSYTTAKICRVRARIVFYTFILCRRGGEQKIGRKMKGEAILTFNCRASGANANWSLASFCLRLALQRCFAFGYTQSSANKL